jgi:transketolase
MANPQLDQLAINTMRTLAMDAVQQADSGHPGTPMAMAPVAYCLWQRFLRFDPEDPIWPNRDRFVLSAGHASMLLYSLLYLTGVKAVNPQYERLGTPSVTLDDIKRFRQLDSKCPGHPEYRWTSGVETTTGPLGQGLATSVGMAIAGRWLGQHLNRPDFPMFDYDVYSLGGDGCMMEGISNEAASLAGHLKLSNLCWIYDNNHITIEGHTALAFSDDVAVRFLGYGWNVTRVGDANDLDMLERAFRVFKDTTDRPTLIIVDSHIAFGAPNKQDTSAAHGEPLGEEEIRLTKKNYGWPEDAKFLVPDGVREHFQSQLGQRGAAARAAWMAKFDEYKKKYPESADHILMMQHRELPAGWDKALAPFPADPKGPGHARLLGQGAQCRGPGRAVADRGRGRPVPLDEDAAHLRGRGRFRGRVVRRAQFPLRHPRARDDRHLQWHVAVEGAALRRRLLHLQRLCARLHPAVRAHGAAGHPHLHPRLDRPRRGRAHAPARRAARLAARDASPDGHAPRGRQ